MKKIQRVSISVITIFCWGIIPVMAQTSEQANAPQSYDCVPNAHCNIYCLVDGEKVFQTTAARSATIRPLTANNYLAEITEQNGQFEFYYVSGAKVVCGLEGVIKSSN